MKLIKRRKSLAFVIGIMLVLSVGTAAFAGCKGKSQQDGEAEKRQEENQQEEETKGGEGGQEEETEGGEQEEETKDEEGEQEEETKDREDGQDLTDGNEADAEEKDTEEKNTEDASKEILKSFQAATLSGDTFTEEDLAKKDMTVINFWATSCGPCISEMPDLAKFSRLLPERVQVVTVCLDGSGAEEDVTEILEEVNFDGITLLSGDGDFEALCYAVMYTPTTIFVDSDGNLAGDVIIGGKQEFQTVYTEALNKALRESGKEEVELDEE